MKTKLDILLRVFIGLSILFMFSMCASLQAKNRPEHKGVDAEFKELVKEYKELAKKQGIGFENEVTIGFKDIDKGAVVGLTSFGDGWREIDIDRFFWYTSSDITRQILLWHELSHAYCTRDHDFGNGQKYPSTSGLRKDKNDKSKEPGYYKEDGCPLTILYPIVLDERCFLSHYNDYVVEMFQRCKSW